MERELEDGEWRGVEDTAGEGGREKTNISTYQTDNSRPTGR